MAPNGCDNACQDAGLSSYCLHVQVWLVGSSMATTVNNTAVLLYALRNSAAPNTAGTYHLAVTFVTALACQHLVHER